MKFAAHAWLWWLLVLPVLYWLFSWDEKAKKRRFQLFADESLWQVLAPQADFKARPKKSRYWLVAAAFLILALARPQWGTHDETVHVTGLDIMIALDVSNSMEVEDIVPSRLKKAKHWIRSLTGLLHGDRVGLVAFAASSYVACPLTTDLDYVLDVTQIMGPKMIANQGTDIGLGLETAMRSLERGSEETKQTAGDNPSRVIILISDGEDHEDEAMEAAQKIKDSGIRLYVLGVGTQKGGPVPVRDENGNLQTYKKDEHGQPVVSTFRPDDLVKIAAAGGGRYWNMTEGENELTELGADVLGLNRRDYAEKTYVVYEERFQIPLAIAIVFILLEMTVATRRRRVGFERSSVIAPFIAPSSRKCWRCTRNGDRRVHGKQKRDRSLSAG